MKFDVFSAFLQHGFDMFLLKIILLSSHSQRINKCKQHYKVLPFAISHKILWCVLPHTGIPYQGRSTWTPKKGNFMVPPYNPIHRPLQPSPLPQLYGSLFPTLIPFSFSVTTDDTVPPFQNLCGLIAHRMIRTWVAF